MKEYEQLGHMRQLNQEEISYDYNINLLHSTSHYSETYTSTTTKFCVGTSLNNQLYIGAPQQLLLLDIIIQFRTHNVTFVADIEKMYHQILIKPMQYL